MHIEIETDINGPKVRELIAAHVASALARIKHRESFRPFAPSILDEATAEYFEQSYPDPFMLKVSPVRPEKRGAIPAVTHVDGTGRLQVVEQNTNSLYYRLLEAFERETGVPVVLNTSFNLKGEPIVNSPDDAISTFLRSDMDALVMGSHLIGKHSRGVPA